MASGAKKDKAVLGGPKADDKTHHTDPKGDELKILYWCPRLEEVDQTATTATSNGIRHNFVGFEKGLNKHPDAEWPMFEVGRWSKETGKFVVSIAVAGLEPQAPVKSDDSVLGFCVPRVVGKQAKLEAQALHELRVAVPMMSHRDLGRHALGDQNTDLVSAPAGTKSDDKTPNPSTLASNVQALEVEWPILKAPNMADIKSTIEARALRKDTSLAALAETAKAPEKEVDEPEYEKDPPKPVYLLICNDNPAKTVWMYMEEELFDWCCEPVPGKAGCYRFTKAAVAPPNEETDEDPGPFYNEDHLYQNRQFNHAKSDWCTGSCNFHVLGVHYFMF